MTPTPASLTGLTAAEVAQRAGAGRINRVRRSDWTEYLDIVQRNVLTLFNALVAAAAAVLFLLRDPQPAVAVGSYALLNTAIGLTQELRAKRLLDRLTLLAEGRVAVVRDGSRQEVPAGDVVEGDVVLLAAGDPVVADGEVLESRYLEVDEALLTGESDPVPRKPGAQVLAGSFCVAGEGAHRADRVGAAAFAQKTAAEARRYKYTASPLQESIDRLIRWLTAITLALSLCYVALYFLRGNIRENELVRMVAATITSMVPQGLVLMTTIALLLGAVRMTARGAVVNRLAAVEAMASIDTLCLDKTGTLTTNQLRLDRLEPLGADEAEVRRLLSLFATCSMDRASKSLAAVRAALGEEPGELIDQLPFKSQNRYSAVRVRAGGGEYALALGACEALWPLLPPGAGGQRRWRELSAGGLRLLLFARVTGGDRPGFGGSLDGFRLEPLALVALSDELRPGAVDVLRHFVSQGVRFKVLSGDNADSVKATVASLGADSDSPALAALAHDAVVTGSELEAAVMPDNLIEERCVFGRVSPWQKVQIIRNLLGRGRRVAMIGDGVNDVLPIKNATLGVAMGDGSRAAKTVAGVVLRTNDFGLLPVLLDEGRTIVRNLRRSGKLFLNKNVYTAVLVVFTLGVFNLPFPYAPQQVTLLNLLTIGLPALLITLDRSKAPATRGSFLGEVGWFAVFTGSVTGLAALAIMLVSAWSWHDGPRTQRGLVLTTLVLLGWVTLWRAMADGSGEQPIPRLLRWVPVAGLPVLLGAQNLGVLADLAGIENGGVRDFFELDALDPGRWAWVLGMTAIASSVLWLGDRCRPGMTRHGVRGK